MHFWFGLAEMELFDEEDEVKEREIWDCFLNYLNNLHFIVLFQI